jgi:hypothetical protein
VTAPVQTRATDHVGKASRTRRLEGHGVTTEDRPVLLLFYSPTSGQSRRAEGFLAQVLQRRRNHATFALRRVDCTSRPDLAARFGIQQVPTFVVVEQKRVRARIELPGSCAEIQSVLAPWLK